MKADSRISRAGRADVVEQQIDGQRQAEAGVRQPDAQEGAVKLQCFVVLEDRHEGDLQGHYQQGDHHDEEQATPGKLHPGEAVGGKGGDQDRDHRGRNGDDQAVQEGGNHVGALHRYRGAIRLPNLERLAAYHLLVVVQGEVRVCGPTLFLDLDGASAPVADPDQLGVAYLNAFAELLEGALAALDLHDAVAVHPFGHRNRRNRLPRTVRDDRPPARGLDVEAGAERRHHQPNGRNQSRR